jgi:protein-S-isoprenylcysteine O-methyltransferase Ste14
VDAIEFSRAALPVAAAAFGGVTLVLPIARLRRRTGKTGITALEGADSVERAISALLLLFGLAAIAWIAAFAAWGPERIGAIVPPAWVTWAGWAIGAAGTILIVVAQRQMGASWRIGIDAAPTALVTGGLFAVVRNPIFTGMLLALAGEVLIVPGVWIAAAWPLAAGLISIQARREELHLLLVHGEPYRAYAARVGRFAPGIGKLR